MNLTGAQSLTNHCEAVPEEVRWVRLAAAGDDEAVLRLLARYRPPLLRLLQGLAGSAAEDVVQEAFLQGFRTLRQLRDPALFYPWLRRLAVRLALREIQRRPALYEGEPEVNAGVDPAGQAETRMAVRAVLARISPELRLTLLLREMEGLEYQEIARELEIPVGTVRSRLAAARERFRELWLELESGADPAADNRREPGSRTETRTTFGTVGKTGDAR